jgi:hypothetical protein
VAYFYLLGALFKELMAESSLTCMADNLPHFPLETVSVICSGNRLPPLADSGNKHTATDSYELQWKTYSRSQMFAPDNPLKCISNIFQLKPLKSMFCNLKSKFPLNVQIKYQLFNVKGRPFD